MDLLKYGQDDKERFANVASNLAQVVPSLEKIVNRFAQLESQVREQQKQLQQGPTQVPDDTARSKQPGILQRLFRRYDEPQG